MTDWFIINDITEFTDKARAIVYNNFGNWESTNGVDQIIDSVKDSDKKDFDRILSHDESLVIVKQVAKKQKNKKTQQVRYIVNEKIFAKIVEDLNSRMVSNVLNELVKKGLVESAYDSESNDFIFWIKDEQDKNNKE